MRKDQEFKAMANCHAMGLYSIPLTVGDDYVERMFIDTLGSTKTVAPHSHRYKLELTVMTGYIQHHIWKSDPSGPMEMYHFAWRSPLDSDWDQGKFTLKNNSPERFKVETRELHPGDYVTLSSDQIHSLWTAPGTSWMIFEYPDDTEDTTTLYGHTEYKPDLSGLYTPMP